MSDPLLVCGWDGEHLIPLRAYEGVANKSLVVGERYICTISEPRSIKAHNFYFASLSEIFKNLPERIAPEFSSVDHFRSRGLIETGWRTERQFIASSRAEAVRLKDFLSGCDPYAVIAVSGAAVIEWRAKSQSMRAMGKTDFAKSADDVLAWGSALIGVRPSEVRAQIAAPTTPALASAVSEAVGPPAVLGSKPAGLDPSGPAGRREPDERR